MRGPLLQQKSHNFNVVSVDSNGKRLAIKHIFHLRKALSALGDALHEAVTQLSYVVNFGSSLNQSRSDLNVSVEYCTMKWLA